MKKLKVAGIVVAGLALLLAIVAGLAFSSSFQTWLVRRQLAGIPGMQITVDRVDAGLSLARVDGLRVVKDGTVATVGAISVRGSALSYVFGGRIKIDEITVTDGRAIFPDNRTATFNLDYRVVDNIGRLKVQQLPLVLAQPFLPAGTRIESGDFSGEFTVRASADGNVVVSSSTPAAFRGMNISARGSSLLKNVDVSTDFTLTHQPKSVSFGIKGLNAGRAGRPILKLDTSATLVIKPDGSMTLNLSGDQLIADDLMGLPGALSDAAPAAAPAAAQSPAAVVADRVPFWGGFSGRVSADFKQVRFGTSTIINGVKGTLALTGNRLAIEGFEGRYGTDPYTLSGAIVFTPGQARPYALTGKANVADLQVGEILRALNPQEKPAIESKVTVVADLGGSGRTAADLAQGVTGKFEVTGGAGVLRALGRKGQAVGTVSAIVGIIGVIQQSQGTTAVASLMSDFDERKFDRFRIVAERGADLGIKLSSIEFLSPTARITGTGVIEHRNDGPILQQPMNIQLKLAAKDYTATLLQRVGLLGSPADATGYYPMAKDFAITGTPAKPDSSQLWQILLGAAATGLLGR